MADDTEALVTTTQENGATSTKESRCVTLAGFGGPRMLKVEPKPEPEPLEGEVLVRVKAW